MKAKPTTLISHDYLIRPKLKEHLRQTLGGRLADELNAGNARIDLAVITDALHGFEIKAENDSLARFFEQQHCYGTVFDYLTLVTTLRKGEKMRDELPDCWGLLVVCEEKGVVNFWQVREPKPNPQKHAMGVLNLLWRSEILAFPGQPGWARGVRSNVLGMRRRIQEIADLPTINAYVCRCLKARQGWRDADGLSLSPFA